jgi:hypothetical protein
MARKLKVFRTPTGFHDAYVAAPSRKAALAAWGADADLFERGVAEEVTDPALMEAALARPGEVIKLSRGDLSAQLNALPPKRKSAAREMDSPNVGENPAARKATRPKPPPKRDRLDAAEAALKAAQARHAAALKRLEDQMAALRAKQDAELQRLTAARDSARKAYRAALEAWSD